MPTRDLLEPDALRSFAIFAEHRNFTTAAAALNISQPSLHVKIRKLAAALGTDLYERSGRSLVLTAAGEQLAVFGAGKGWQGFARESGSVTGETTEIAQRPSSRVICHVSNTYC